MLRMVAENFGPLRSVAIEQSPFMVFAGDSNTGKSYMARLFYAMYSAMLGFPRIPFLNEAMYQMHVGVEKGSIAPDVFGAFMDSVHTAGHCLLSDVPGALEYILAQLHTESHYHDTIAGTFDVLQLSALHQWGQKDDLRVLLDYTEDAHQIWGIDYTVSSSGDAVFESTLSDNARVDIDEVPVRDSVLRERSFIDYGRHVSAQFLPDTRIGLLQMQKLIFAGSVDNFSRNNKPRTFITSPVASFLESLVMYKPSDRFKKLAHDVGLLLGGDVISQESFAGGLPSFYYVPSGNDIPLNFYQTSGFVASVAPILLAIRGMVYPGDLLVIEDVDMHLNSDQLATLGVILLRLSEAGVNVIVTTGEPHLFPQLGTDVRVWEFADGYVQDVTER